MAVTLERDREDGAVRASVFKAGKLLGVQGKATWGGWGLHRQWCLTGIRRDIEDNID